jgi:hypothetical protein
MKFLSSLYSRYDTSGGVAVGYGWTTRNWFVYSAHLPNTNSGTNHVFCPVGTRGCFPRLETGCSFSSSAKVKECLAIPPLHRSEWPHGLRHELSLLTRTQGSWV